MLAVLTLAGASLAYTSWALIRQDRHLCLIERSERINARAIARQLHVRLPVEHVPGC